ncbi:MAG: hypothetical protein KAV87_68640 [Desulfobacteraceae bacterium]|nr:hypothetical protein [Desulfobacteraceae bacterium]
MSPNDESQEELIHDVLVLVGRLYFENPDTFSPETLAVMERWKPRWDIEFKKLCASGSSQVW